ncbi:MAG: phenyltransferase domain-containing protein, partial [Desulfobacterales bacterium]
MPIELYNSPQKDRSALSVAAVAGLIAAAQKPSGEIPWSQGDKTDPWDHIEAAMGLQVGGCLAEARHAFH